VDIHVVQGERPMAAENKSLGQFILDGILPAPRGLPQIEVTFDIDANGILNVSAKDKGTGKEQKIVIQASSGLSEAEIQRMVHEAEQHAAEDAERREQVELRNQADAMAYAAEKQLGEIGDRLPSDTKLEIENQVQAIRRALESNDTASLRPAMESLERALQRAGEAVYAGAGASTGGGSNYGPTGNSDTVEGEYREV